MSASSATRPDVLAMYRAHPFPQWTSAERLRQLPNEILRYEFLGIDSAMAGARFLDVGCGTGNRSMKIAKHYGVREFVGFDGSPASLAVAERVAREEGVDQFRAVEGSLFDLPWDDGYFDVVVSWGVLHHTDDPFGGLKEMTRVCRPGGFVGLFLYNKWNHWRHNAQKNRVDRIAGADVEKRFEIAHRLYGTKPVEEMSPEEVAVFYDQYCHPHKSDHTIGETLRWFDALGLEPWGSYPPLGIRAALSALHRRAELSETFPLRSKKWETILKGVRRLPFGNAPPPKRPSLPNRALWQAIYAVVGRDGSYSWGAAMSARKPPR